MLRQEVVDGLSRAKDKVYIVEYVVIGWILQAKIDQWAYMFI